MWHELAIYSLVFIRGLAGLLFFYGYLKSKRLSAFFIALSWLFSIPSATWGVLVDFRTEALFTTVGLALLIVGIIRFIKEEIQLTHHVKSVYLVPLITVVIGLISVFVTNVPEEGFIFSGLFTLIAAMIFMEALKKIYRRDIVILALLIGSGGIGTVFYAYLYSHPEVAPLSLIFFLVSLLYMLYLYYKIIFSDRFFKKALKNINIESLEIEGISIVSPEEFKNWKTVLSGYPLLAFVRCVAPAEGWVAYRFSSVEGENAIYPTDLYKIPEFVFKYLREAKNKDVKGVVLIEGLEFLRVYNDFQSIAKMMASVRDYVISYDGTLIVVLSKEAWDEKEFNTLVGVLR